MLRRQKHVLSQSTTPSRAHYLAYQHEELRALNKDPHKNIFRVGS